MNIRYYDRTTGRQVKMEVPADVVCITISANEVRPAIEVNVNTETAFVATTKGNRLGRLDYTDLIAEAIAAGEFDEEKENKEKENT